MVALGFLKNLVGGGKHDRDAKTKTTTATTTQTETREDEGDDDAVVAEVARGDFCEATLGYRVKSNAVAFCYVAPPTMRHSCWLRLRTASTATGALTASTAARTR